MLLNIKKKQGLSASPSLPSVQLQDDNFEMDGHRKSCEKYPTQTKTGLERGHPGTQRAKDGVSAYLQLLVENSLHTNLLYSARAPFKPDEMVVFV
jgi:hypothetical protein